MDLDGNGLGDIVLTDATDVHAYYNLGNDNWEMDIIATQIGRWDRAGFINSDGSKTLFTTDPSFADDGNDFALNNDVSSISISDLFFNLTAKIPISSFLSTFAIFMAAQLPAQ